ncbi:MAG: hypothetical protein F4W89_13330 [Acidobacteria bacterium]|nr:hypothetical protein [Acidobacteriota bacterium]
MNWRGGGAARMCATVVVAGIGIGALAPQSALAQGGDSRASATIGMDFSHAYLFRGIKQETGGLIAQPYADASFSLLQRDEGLTGVTFTIGTWNSLHTGETGADGPALNVKPWYESDFFTGFGFGFDNWSAGLTYTSYLSPNDSFSTVHELALTLAMDDSDLLRFPMSPHVGLAIEMDGQADGGASEGVYVELGVEPAMEILDGRVTLALPATLGLSLTNYYEDGADADDRFGFFDLGLVASMPLSVPEGYGAWELTGGVHALLLGGYLETLNDGNEVQVVGSIGFSVGY